MCYKNGTCQVVLFKIPCLDSTAASSSMNSFTSYKCVYKIGCVYVHVYITTYTNLASQPLPLLIPSHEGAKKGLVSRLCKFRSTALEIVRPIRSPNEINAF